MSTETSVSEDQGASQALRRRRPSTMSLVLLNACAFVALLVPGLNPVGLIFAIPATVIFLTLSGVWQAFWYWLERRFQFYNIVRIIGYVLPVIAVVVLPLLGLQPERPLNKQQPAVSESGLYHAYVRAKSGGWRIEIEDKDGETLYEEQTRFVPHLNVYWIWGPQDRLWLYNSDDGRVHCWIRQQDRTWRHVQWGYGRTCETDEDIGSPPESLYPDYAQQEINESE